MPPQIVSPFSRRARWFGLVSQPQNDFSAGAFPQNENVPLNGAEDIINGLIDDDGSILRRAGTTYKTTTDTTGDIIGLWDGALQPGHRTLFESATTAYQLSPTDDATPQQLAGSLVFAPGRWTVVNRMAIRAQAPPNQGTLLVAGGVAPFTAVNAGTATFTPGSNSVTGAGVDWIAAGVQPGSLIIATGTGLGRAGIVHNVPSSTQIVLTDPWQYSAQTAGAYSIQAAYTFAFPAADAVVAEQPYPVYVAQMFDRLMVANGNRISFSDFIIDTGGGGASVPAPLNFGANKSYHLLPDGVIVTGLEALGDTLLIFTTAGAWGLTGLAFDITDPLGNPQHRLAALSRDLVLWGDAGLASWEGALVVPGLRDVYLFTPSSQTPFTGGAGRLYRGYVKAGYQPGKAIVHRGHYLLPVLNSSNQWVDLLVWRLDAPGRPFTRWAGHGGSAKAFHVRTGATTRQPALFGGVGTRLEDFTGCFDPGQAKQDADSSTHELEVTTRTLQVAAVPTQWRKIRVRYELDDAATDNPTVTLEVATGRPGNSFTALSGTGVEGEQSVVWLLSKRALLIRFRIRSQGPSAVEKIRSVDAFYRFPAKR